MTLFMFFMAGLFKDTAISSIPSEPPPAASGR